MIVLSILITAYWFWSMYAVITELYQEKYEEYFENKMDDAIHITNMFNFGIIILIFFILWCKGVYLVLSCL